MAKPATCRIDFNVDDRRRAVAALVDRVSRVATTPGAAPVTLDLSKCKYLGPDGVAVLAALVLDLRDRGVMVDVLVPTEPAQLRAFCRDSGLLAVAQESGGDRFPAGEEEQPVLPIRQIRTASFHDADPIMNMLQRFGSPHPEFDEYLRICVNEVVQNVQDHAESRVGGVMTARYMAATAEVRVAIVDRGAGICTTLRRRWPDTTAENVMPRVLLEGEYSARSRENNLGLGLSNLARIIRRLDGSLFVLSETAAAELGRSGRNWFGRLTSPFQGTGVFFTLPVREQS